MKAILVALSILTFQSSAFADIYSEIKAKAISQVEFQLNDKKSELGRAHLRISADDGSSGSFTPEQNSADAMILSQMGSRTETSSTVLVRIPYTDSRLGAMWSRRSISVLVNVNTAYEDETNLTSFQILVQPKTIKVNIEN